MVGFRRKKKDAPEIVERDWEFSNDQMQTFEDLHNAVVAQLAEDRKEFLEDQQLEKLMQTAKNEFHELSEGLAQVQKFLVKEREINSGTNLSRIQRAPELENLRKQIKLTEERARELTLNLRSKVEYIEKMAAQIADQKMKDKKVEQYLTDTVDRIRTKLGEVERDILNTQPEEKIVS